MRTGRHVASASLALALLGGLSSLGGCGGEETETGTLAPAMTPEDLKEMEQSEAAYKAASEPRKKK